MDRIATDRIATDQIADDNKYQSPPTTTDCDND
jgi:hypothetical protein